jgi:hypothetical protein
MLPSINSLQKEQSKNNIVKHNLYKIILKRCGQRIIEANKKTHHTYCFFEVPTIIIGHNDYSVTDCVKYLIQELVKEGYVVEFIQPNYLYIDWGKPLTKTNEYIPNWIENKTNFEKQAKKYIKRYPDAKIEIVYDKKK